MSRPPTSSRTEVRPLVLNVAKRYKRQVGLSTAFFCRPHICWRARALQKRFGPPHCGPSRMCRSTVPGNDAVSLKSSIPQDHPRPGTRSHARIIENCSEQTCRVPELLPPRLSRLVDRRLCRAARSIRGEHDRHRCRHLRRQEDREHVGFLIASALGRVKDS